VTVVSGRWFPEKERATATSLSYIAMTLGNAAIEIYAPFIVQGGCKNENDKKRSLKFEHWKISRSISYCYLFELLLLMFSWTSLFKFCQVKLFFIK